MLATVTAYGVGKFIHILAVILAFGPTYAYPIFIGVAERTSPRALPTVLRGLEKVDRYFVTPGMVVILAAGIYLVSKGNWDVSNSFVSEGIAAILVLFALTGAFFTPQTRRARELAERDLASGDELSAEYGAVSKRIARVGALAGLIVAVTVFFMVVKP
jgi:uncharacterized membrane protein